MIRGPFRPPPGYKYPQKIIGGIPRRFQPEWFTKYDWLEYSEKVHKCFCLYCYLFRDCNECQGGNDAFAKNGWDGFNKSDRLQDHVGTRPDSFHNTAIKRCNNLMKPEKSIVASMKKGRNATKEEYLLRLNTSIDVVRYLLRQGLAFCGHDESKESLNQGDFLELVKLLGKQNVKTNKAILWNAQMLAPDIHKDIVDCFADVRENVLLIIIQYLYPAIYICKLTEFTFFQIIVKFIIKEIGGDVFFLLVDESSDVSGKEQMAVVLRYVDKLGLIKERLIGVVHVKETSTSCLKSNIDVLFGKYGLSIKQVRGQGYDGASNMRGEFNGLRALIMRENSSAHYIHVLLTSCS
jgi:hypothetical protein